MRQKTTNPKTKTPTKRRSKGAPATSSQAGAPDGDEADNAVRLVDGGHVSRRGFITGVGVVAGGASAAVPAKAAKSKGVSKMGPARTRIMLTVNGKARAVSVEPRVTLLRALRNELDITGPKEVCDRGACGACTVIIDGETVTSCMMLAVDAVGKQIETIEGISDGGKLHPLQEAFCEFDALQCGFCTPGFVMAGKNLIDRAQKENRRLELPEIKQGLCGNICRCGTYNRVFDAVAKVANGKA